MRAEARSCETSLTARVLEYQRSGKGREALISSLSLFCYRYSKRVYRLCEDESSEFFLYLYPKILRMVKDFQNVGKPFENYVASVLKWQMKAYNKKKRSQEKKWNSATRIDMWDMPARSDFEIESPDVNTVMYKALGVTEGKIVDPVLQRRFLIFCLKSAYFLKDEDIRRIACMTDFSEIWIHRTVHALRETLASRRERHHKLTRRRNRAFYKLTQLEDELKDEVDPGRRQTRLRELARLRGTMRNAMREISRIKFTPSNNSIAGILHMPKGTVDSDFYWLHRRFTEYEDLEVPQYA